MLTVHKFALPFPVTDRFELRLPRGARLLSLQCQQDEPKIWALVESDAPNEVRTFRLVGTGHPIPGILIAEQLRFVGTFQMMDGSLVFHVFEQIELAAQEEPVA